MISRASPMSSSAINTNDRCLRPPDGSMRMYLHPAVRGDIKVQARAQVSCGLYQLRWRCGESGPSGGLVLTRPDQVKPGGWRVRGIWFGLVLAVCVMSGTARSDDSAIGFVKYLKGDASALRNGQHVKLAISAPVLEHDVLETGENGEMGISFRDDTRISLGASTKFDLSQFIFQPAEHRFGLVFKLLNGSAQYISGLMAKLAPGSVSLSTPQFTIAVRGTRLLLRAEN